MWLRTPNDEGLIVVTVISHDVGLEELLIAAIRRASECDGRRREWAAAVTIETTSVIESPVGYSLVAATNDMDEV